jgi:HAD superfamily hydrolase (TIGR01509 family)
MKRERVIAILREEQPVFEGLTALVSKLAPHYHLALASGSERGVVDAVLELEGLQVFFPVTVSGSEVSRGKPQPDIFLITARLLGVQPADCWVIEDSKPGVAAGLAAGMRVIAITNTHPASDLNHATRVVDSYREIEELLLPRNDR